MKILHPICLKFAVISLLFYTAAWSRQRPLSCWSWHGRNDFRLLINRTWKLLAKVFKWSPIVCLLLLTVMKNPEKYKCGSLRVKISECGRFYTPMRERTSKWEISGISSFVQETPAQNGRVGRYDKEIFFHSIHFFFFFCFFDHIDFYSGWDTNINKVTFSKWVQRFCVIYFGLYYVSVSFR